MLDPTSEALLRWWLDMTLRTGALFCLARALDRLLRDYVDPSTRMWLYTPVWLRLLVPLKWSSPVAALPPVSLVLMGPVQAAGDTASAGAPSLALPWPALGLLWGAGILALGLSSLWQRYRFERALQGARRSVELQHALHSPVPVLVHPRLGPLVYGIVHPVLVLPHALSREPLAHEARCAVAHELSHLEQRHLPLSAALQASCIVLWPLLPLWLAARRLHALVEQAADAGALSRLPQDAFAYGRVLVGLPHVSPTVPIGGFPMAAYENLRERIYALVHPARWPRALTLPLVLVLGVGGMGLATEVAASDPQPAGQVSWFELQRGRSLLLTTPAAPSSVKVGDPAVLDFGTLGDPRKLFLRGLKEGETTLTVNLEGKSPLVYEVTVVVPEEAPEPGALEVRTGERLTVKLPGVPLRVAAGDPSIVSIDEGAPDTEIVLVGLAPGRSDFVVLTAPKGTPLIYAVLVTH